MQEINESNLLILYRNISFKAINPEFGTMDDFKLLVKKAHQMGFKVFIDIAAKVSSWDNEWILEHPDWIVKDSLGNASTPDQLQYDVVELNYGNMELRNEMLDVFKFWVVEAGIDGFRCDGSNDIPTEFWINLREELNKIKPVFLISDYKEYKDIPPNIFNSNFDWNSHSNLFEFLNGKMALEKYRSEIEQINYLFPEDTYPLQFITFHDLNSWSGTDRELYGESLDASIVLSFTLPGMPLMLNGQEAGLNKRIKFFDKDSIDWKKDPSRSVFYSQLINLKKNNPSLWNGNSGGIIKLLDTSEPDNILAFKRLKEKDTVIVVLNLSGNQTTCYIFADDVSNDMVEYFSGKKISTDKKILLQMEPWDYLVYTDINK